MDKDFGLEYLCQVKLIDKVKVQNDRIPICEFAKRKNIETQCRKKESTENISKKGVIVRIMNLNLSTPLDIPSRVGNEVYYATPLRQLSNSCPYPCWTQRDTI